ncbi:unnamed protein product [Cunninghamella echinulata]
MKLSIIVSSLILIANVATADSLDWRDRISMRVKNQGSCGSQYAFSAIGAVEGALAIKYNQSYDLSEQHLVDCGGKGCNGGWMHDMFDYLRKSGGPTLQADYPYTAIAGACQAQSKRKVGTVVSHKMVRPGDENDLMEALKIGPVAVAYNAGSQAHKYYRGGIFDVPNCGNTPTHAVLLIGYGNENGKDYWLLKNSWGADWGEKGYFRMARGKNMCGIADWASYPIV